MATKIKIIHSKDFIEVTPEGMFDVDTSRKLLVEIAKSEHLAEDYELFVDFRDTKCNLSVLDVYQLAAELYPHGDTFRRKVALLVDPGINFDRASFFETCSHNRGFSIDAFTDYEKAMRWILAPDDLPGSEVSAKYAGVKDGKWRSETDEMGQH